MKITAFPALDGDCLLLAWTHAGATRRMLIDGGRTSAWKVLKAHALELPEEERQLDLLVISHIDADHIEGVLKMLEDDERPFTFAEAWFNGYGHLIEENEEFGPAQGERLSKALADLGIPWNGRFGSRAVVTVDDEDLPMIEFPGLTLTLLSPTRPKLVKLAREWEKWLKKEGVSAVDIPELDEPTTVEDDVEYFGRRRELPDQPLDVKALSETHEVSDPEPPNGSSIAFIADDGHHRCLFGADAHPDVLKAALERLPEADRRFDLFKLPHHGSAKNISRDILELIDCRKFLISTNGNIHQHPDPEAIARILQFTGGQKTLYFNYAQDWTMLWDDRDLKRDHKYRAVYALPDKDGLIEISL